MFWLVISPLFPWCCRATELREQRKRETGGLWGGYDEPPVERNPRPSMPTPLQWELPDT